MKLLHTYSYIIQFFQFDSPQKNEFQEIVNEMNNLVQEMMESELKLSNYLQNAQTELDQLEEFSQNLQEQYQILQEMLQKDVEEYNDELENTQQILEKVEFELESTRQKEIKLDEEIKYYQNMKDLYKEKEREFYSLYQECDQINTINHELNDELEDLEQENGNLENECWQLQQQTDEQYDQIKFLELQNQKTEKLINELDQYQDQIKNLMKDCSSTQKNEQFDPLIYIKSVQNKQLEDEMNECKDSLYNQLIKNIQKKKMIKYRNLLNKSKLETTIKLKLKYQLHSPLQAFLDYPIIGIGNKGEFDSIHSAYYIVQIYKRKQIPMKQFSSEFFDSVPQNQKLGINNFCMQIFRQQSFDEQQNLEYINLTEQNLLNMYQMSKNPSLDGFIQKKSSVLKAIKKPRAIPAIRDYKKNICRNILRHAIRDMQNSKEYLSKQTDNADEFIQYYQNQLEFITGFRLLKNHLLILDSDDEQTTNRKQVFQRYLNWFLKEKATRYIIQGEASNRREYIRYKNEVLLFYVQRPEAWYSNKPLWRMEKRKSLYKKQ